MKKATIVACVPQAVPKLRDWTRTPEWSGIAGHRILTPKARGCVSISLLVWIFLINRVAVVSPFSTAEWILKISFFWQMTRDDKLAGLSHTQFQGKDPTGCLSPKNCWSIFLNYARPIFLAHYQLCQYKSVVFFWSVVCIQNRTWKKRQLSLVCPRRELNPHGHCWPQDFKSCVSTSSTTRAGGISNFEISTPYNKKNPPAGGIGAEDRARTGHPNLGKVVLYQMSYFRVWCKELKGSKNSEWILLKKIMELLFILRSIQRILWDRHIRMAAVSFFIQHVATAE